MAKITLEALSVGGEGVTMGQVTDLITKAQMSGAPPNAEIGWDGFMEFRSPARARRVTITWEV
jgi:hypothetical protein